MTREECESKIAELANEIRKVYKEYLGNPNEDYYLTVNFHNSYLQFNNDHWDGKPKIDYAEFGEEEDDAV